MRIFTHYEIADNFKSILPFVQKGESVGISDGKSKKPIAMLIPFKSEKMNRKIAVLEGKAIFKEKGNGKITEEEFLGL